MKFFVLAILVTTTANFALAQSSLPPVIGTYESHTESSYHLELTLGKNGVANYRQPDFEQPKKSFAMAGRWSQAGDEVEVDFGKRGKYVYAISPNLSWEEFGCKGGSFGLAVKSTPETDMKVNLWRKESSKKRQTCHR